MASIPAKVQPGDLIASEFLNALIDVCSDLEDRVGRLESPSASTARTKITDLLPSGTKRIGDTLHIIGVGFNAAGATSVLIDGMQVLPTPGPVRDKELIVTIPNLQAVGVGGRIVSVLVSNVNGTDLSDFQVFPAIETLPQGNLFVSLSASPPGNLTANSNPVFEFTIKGFLNLAERFTLAASTTAGWQCAILKNNAPDPDPVIDLPAGAPPDGMPPVVVRVRVSIPANPATTSTSLRLSLTSQRNTTLSGSSAGDPLVLGSAGPAPEPVSIQFDSIDATNPNTQPQPPVSTDPVKVPGGAGSYRLTFNAKPLTPNVVYTRTISALPTGWTASFARTTTVLQQDFGPVGANALETFFVFVTATANAAAIEMSIQVVSKTNSNDKGHINQKLAVA